MWDFMGGYALGVIIALMVAWYMQEGEASVEKVGVDIPEAEWYNDRSQQNWEF